MTIPSEPFSRKEQYLSKIAGDDHGIPAEPFSREEQYLAAIAENGGGGGGGGALEPIEHTFDPDTGTITTVKTAQGIIDDLKSGKFLYIPVDMSSDEEIILAQVLVGAVVVNEYGPIMVAGAFGGDGPQQFIFQADSLDDPFVGNVN